MRIHRRQFLKYCVSSAAALSLPMSVLGRLEQALAADNLTLPKVIWLNGANCTGCTVSLANLFSDSGPTDIVDLLFNTIDLAFHPNLMGAAGDLAVQQLHDTAQGSYVLAVDGGVPTAFDGHACLLWTEQGQEITAMEAVTRLASGAAAILSIGTCASYGGMPAGNPNPTGVVSVAELTGRATINIPGCPTHPDWIVWTVAHLLSGEMPTLDQYSRPAALYGSEIHKICPRKGNGEAKTFGSADQCLKELGCKGPKTKSDCPSRKWNSASNWCIGAGALCIGCTEQGFPDKFSPFYSVEYSYNDYQKTPPENPDPENPPTDPEQGSLQFIKAEYQSKSSLLKAQGKGDSGKIVMISDARSGSQLAAVSVDAKGTWKLQQKNPSPIPTRLKAVCGGHIAYCDVVQTGNTNVKQEKDKTKHKKDDKKKSSKRSDR